MSISIIVSGNALAGLRKLRNRLNSQSAVYKKLSTGLLTLTKNTFKNSSDPYGEPWKPIVYRVGKPLIKTGRLLASMQGIAEPDRVIIGTNTPYGKYHQQYLRPSKWLPRRAFLPTRDRRMPNSWGVLIKDTEISHLKK